MRSNYNDAFKRNPLSGSVEQKGERGRSAAKAHSPLDRKTATLTRGINLKIQQTLTAVSYPSSDLDFLMPLEQPDQLFENIITDPLFIKTRLEAQRKKKNHEDISPLQSEIVKLLESTLAARSIFDVQNAEVREEEKNAKQYPKSKAAQREYQRLLVDFCFHQAVRKVKFDILKDFAEHASLLQILSSLENINKKLHLPYQERRTVLEVSGIPWKVIFTPEKKFELIALSTEAHEQLSICKAMKLAEQTGLYPPRPDTQDEEGDALSRAQDFERVMKKRIEEKEKDTILDQSLSIKEQEKSSSDRDLVEKISDLFLLNNLQRVNEGTALFDLLKLAQNPSPFLIKFFLHNFTQIREAFQRGVLQEKDLQFLLASEADEESLDILGENLGHPLLTNRLVELIIKGLYQERSFEGHLQPWKIYDGKMPLGKGGFAEVWEIAYIVPPSLKLHVGAAKMLPRKVKIQEHLDVLAEEGTKSMRISQVIKGSEHPDDFMGVLGYSPDRKANSDDSITKSETPMIVYELIKSVEGKGASNLHTLNEKLDIPNEEFYRLILIIFRALHRLHQSKEKLVYADLKPGNMGVLKNANGRYQSKLLDYGAVVTSEQVRDIKIQEDPCLMPIDLGTDTSGNQRYARDEKGQIIWIFYGHLPQVESRLALTPGYFSDEILRRIQSDRSYPASKLDLYAAGIMLETFLRGGRDLQQVKINSYTEVNGKSKVSFDIMEKPYFNRIYKKERSLGKEKDEAIRLMIQRLKDPNEKKYSFNNVIEDFQKIGIVL